MMRDSPTILTEQEVFDATLWVEPRLFTKAGPLLAYQSDFYIFMPAAGIEALTYVAVETRDEYEIAINELRQVADQQQSLTDARDRLCLQGIEMQWCGGHSQLLITTALYTEANPALLRAVNV